MLSRFLAYHLLGSGIATVATGKYLIAKRGDIIQSLNFQYCIGILISTKNEYGFMHYQGCEKRSEDDKTLCEMIDLLNGNSAAAQKLDAKIYCRISSDDFSSILDAYKIYNPHSVASCTQHNLYMVMKILDKYNIPSDVKLGGHANVEIDQDCKIHPIEFLQSLFSEARKGR